MFPKLTNIYNFWHKNIQKEKGRWWVAEKEDVLKMEVYQLEWARFLRICGQVPQEVDNYNYPNTNNYVRTA